MTDSPYPPDWDDTPPPDPMDPRLGHVLAPIHPTNAERALVADLAHMYVSRDHDFAERSNTSGATGTPTNVGPTCSWRC